VAEEEGEEEGEGEGEGEEGLLGRPPWETARRALSREPLPSPQEEQKEQEEAEQQQQQQQQEEGVVAAAAAAAEPTPPPSVPKSSWESELEGMLGDKFRSVDNANDDLDMVSACSPATRRHGQRRRMLDLTGGASEQVSDREYEAFLTGGGQMDGAYLSDYQTIRPSCTLYAFVQSILLDARATTAMVALAPHARRA
jgi:hypothetical protein